MKYITVKLTEDQARELMGALELQLKPIRWYINEWAIRNNNLGYKPIKGWNKESLERSEHQLAFKQRLISKLQAELVKL